MSSKRKAGLFLMTLAAMMGLMLALAGAAYADEAVEYQEASWDDTNKQVVYTTKSIPNDDVSSYTPVTSDMDTSWDNESWYVVSSDVTIEKGIHVSGTVNLILCDGCKLTANVGINLKENNTLNIYGQSDGTGELVIDNAPFAGIGGDLGEAGGEVTIHGGIVTVDIFGGTGIGGGGPVRVGFAGGEVTIYGGKVTATGGGAGIGGGDLGAGGTVTIYGGAVTAEGFSGAGIGGGYGGAGGTVTINGGIVIASGGEDYFAGLGMGIGHGCGGTDNGTLSVAENLAVYGGETEYPTTVINEADSDYPRFRYMKVDCPQHTFTYSASGATISAVCSETSCNLPGKKADLTIAAPERTTYGDTAKSAEATLTGLSIFRAVTGLSAGDILYSGRGDTTYAESSTPPEAAGDYTAKVTVTGETAPGATQSYTASVDYTIAKAGSSCTPPEAREGLKYTGSLQALVEAGTAEGGTLTYALGEDETTAPTAGWSETIPEGKDAGDYYVWYKVEGDKDHKDTTPACITVTIAKIDSSCTPPVAKDGLKYTGSPQALVDAGTAEGGTLTYALGEDETTAPTAGWSEIIPAGTDAGTYHVWYKVAGDKNHNDTAAACITVTIAKVDSSCTPPEAREGLKYTGSLQALVDAGTAEGGTLTYAFGEDEIAEPTSGWSEIIPAGTDAGTYHVWYKVAGDKDHNDTAAACITVSIAKVDSSCTPPVAKDGLKYTGSPQALVDAGTAEGGTLTYALGEDEITAPTAGWSETIPAGTGAGTYHVWYKVSGDKNHNDTAPTCITVTIAKVEPAGPTEADIAAANEAAGMINALPSEITLADEETVAAVRAAYDALTETQKGLVGEETLAKLTAAEDTIAGQKQHEQDQAAADKAITKIDALPAEITLADEETVAAARAAYDALTETQKGLVGEEILAKLAAAEDAIAGWNQYEQDVKAAKAVPATLTKVKPKKGRKAIVRWEQAEGAAGYILQYSCSAEFSKKVKEKEVSAEKTKQLVSKLKKGKKYFFRICVCTDVTNPGTGVTERISGTWSNVKKAKVK